jgi:hypothetical protein
MEKRRIPRFDQQVKITQLEHPYCSFMGTLTNFSAYGVGLLLKQDLPIGCLVKLEWGNTILLGELIYCQPSGNEFVAGLEVEDIVYKSAQLRRIEQAWQ